MLYSMFHMSGDLPYVIFLALSIAAGFAALGVVFGRSVEGGAKFTLAFGAVIAFLYLMLDDRLVMVAQFARFAVFGGVVFALLRAGGGWVERLNRAYRVPPTWLNPRTGLVVVVSLVFLTLTGTVVFENYIGGRVVSEDAGYAGYVMLVPAAWYLLAAAIFFVEGAGGVLLRREMPVMLMCVLVMLNGVELSFLALGRHLHSHTGRVFALISMGFSLVALVAGMVFLAGSPGRYEGYGRRENYAVYAFAGAIVVMLYLAYLAFAG